MLKKINYINIVIKYITVIILGAGLISCKNENNSESETVDVLVKIGPEAVVLNNKGVGEMGSFDYNKAVLTFENLSVENQQWSLGQQNLAIALLNRQMQGDEEKALSIAEKLSKEDSKNLVAQYIVAILKFNQGLCAEATPRFEIIIESDKTDAYALYFAGQCYLQNGEIEKALVYYQKSIKADGYLRSAYYGSFMAAQRLKKTVVAKNMLNAYRKLGSNPKARLAEIKYTRMGPKANARAYRQTFTAVISSQVKIQAPFFNSPIPISLGNIANIENMGVVNMEQTQQAQFYIVANNMLNIYQSLSFNALSLPIYSLKLDEGQHKMAWGDINNDSKIDVYITGKQDKLYLQGENGFKAVNMRDFGLSPLSSSAVRLVDADHDGDLDILLLSRLGVFEIWNNNLNNTFTALSNEIELPSEPGYVGIFIQDIDSDRDVDIILLAEKHTTTLLNDRMWSYEILASEKYDSVINSLSFADNDLNGKPELSLLFADKKIIISEFDRAQKIYIITRRISDVVANHMLQVDVNGNAQSEYIISNDEGIKVMDSQGNILEQIVLNQPQQIKMLNTINGPELLVLHNDQLTHLTASANRLPFILLLFSGKEDDANSVRSNYSGLGTNFIVRNQGFYAIGDSFHNLTGIDQDYQAVALASGSSKGDIDFIEVQWSDGVYQTELSLKTKEYHMITETQRQLSSCPVIFAWNNGQYEFVSDVLGVGGLGFAVARNEYGVPRPWENYLLSSEQLSADNGVFKLQFTEPMEESAYLDELQIRVLDVPNQWSVILDERMGISAPDVTGEPLFYKSVISPIQVLDKYNQDVTARALTTDKKAIDINNHDHRFLGLVDEQIITMEFANEIIGDYHLIINGWVEYGYSQTMFAAWQAGIKARAPTIEYKSNGEWKVLLSEFGYPAGMPRAATVPITIPEASRFLRISTNMEIYFDQFGLIKTGVPISIKWHNLTLEKAQLYQLGFPQRTDNDQRVPDYLFSKKQPFWDTRYMEGAYTQLGIITELLKHQDNAVAIIAAGEAIELFFPDDLPQLEENFDRYYLLQFKGWAKDMDILTQYGETLEPIPANGKVSEHARYLNEKYNNRFKAGR
ncbi:MAG: VCBS repeat-containing protein [Alcanivoracaceae bacterium]|nr:VCBS repeat-containing protein [Alcanivoracaceae bacterium]